MQIPKNKSIRTVICISFVTVFLLSFGLTDLAYADHTATQPNAYASYNSDTNEVQVEWDFTNSTGGSAPETCLLKGDFWYHTDLNINYDTDTSDNLDPTHPGYNSLTRVTGFIPLYYSVVSTTPSTIQTISEVIPCTGSTRIDIDTVMSHPLNVKLDGVTPRQDLQIFLSFYSLHENKAFTFDHIDEIFVAYTPNVTWSVDFRTYACEGQKGNTIYIDQSADGIHGNNGDNCDQYLELNSNQWVDIGMNDATGDPLPGVAEYGTHVASSFQTLIVVHYPYESEYRGSSCADCVAPTFGLDDNNFLIVTNGFSYNGNATDVTDYHTKFPLITTVTNNTNTVLVKVYENNGINNIKLVQFGLGMPEVGSALEHAETLIEIWLEKGQVVKIVEEDDNDKNNNNIDLVTIVSVETSEIDCGGTNQKCLAVKLQYFYNDQPKYNILAINAIDFKRNSQTNYLNEGVEVTGDSLNEPLTQKVTISNAGAFYPQKSGSTILTLSDYKTDTWIDEYGYIWSTNEYGPYLVDIIPIPEQTPDVISSWSGYNDRLHSEFGKYVKMQQEKAVIILDEMDKQERNGIMNYPTIPDYTVVYDGIDRDDLNLSEILIKEAQRVLVEYEKQNNPYIYKEYEKHIFDQTIKEILSSERADNAQLIKPMAFLDIKILNNALTITGNIGDADTNKPVILKSMDGDKVLKKPIFVNADGLFNMGFLSNDHTDFVLSHDGVILKEFDYSTL